MKQNWNQGIIYWFANNSVAANLLMLCLLLGGSYMASTMQKETFPATSTDTVRVTMVYPGAAPEEVERGICAKIEDAVTGLQGVDKTTCISSEGLANAILEIDDDYELREVMAEIKNRVDGVNSFPVQAEKPVISEIMAEQPVMFVSVFSDVPKKELLKTARQIRDDIIDLPSVSMATILGNHQHEIAIEISEKNLLRYQLTFDEVAAVLRAASLDVPAGSIKTDRGDILLRAVGQAYLGDDFANLTIRSNADGSNLRLKDIAEIKDGFEENTSKGTFDGKRSINIQIKSLANESVLDIADEVNAYVAEKHHTMPANIYLSTWSDTSHYVRGRLNMMQRNMLQGAVLVLLTLTLFLRLRVAFWVMVGLPVAFLGAFLFLPLVGGSINMLSMFGFILVLGIVVDDAIVIGESSYTQIQKHGHSLKNVVIGAQKVATPATFGVLTTVAAFLPMLFIGTLFGSFFEAIAWVVILCLLFSLVESKLILPSHLAHMKHHKEPQTGSGLLLRMRRAVNRGLNSLIENHYQPLIERAIRRPILTLAIFIAIFLVSLGLVRSQIVRFVMMPDFVADFVQADFAMSQGTSKKRTETVLKQVENALLHLDRDISQQHGKPSGMVFKHRLAFTEGQVTGKVIVELVKDEDSVISGKQMLKKWTEYVGEIPGATHFGTMALTGPGQGPDISLKLVGSELDKLRMATDELAAKLAAYDGVSDIRNSIEEGNREIKFKLKPLGQNLGLSQADLGRQLRQSYYGEEVQRVQRGDDEVRVILRYDRDSRELLYSLSQLRIRTKDGQQIPLQTVADIHLGKAPNSIERVNRKRVARLTAMVDKGIANPQSIITELQTKQLPKIMEKYQVRDELDGMSKEIRQLSDKLILGMLAANFLIYVLIAIPLKSYLQPLIIMSVIPFGITGAIFGHLIVGETFSMMSLFGVVALFGVVVNDSLVMVDYVNKERASGHALIDAVKQAGKHRFRAIMLTSLTTFFGLLPIMFEQSLQAKVVVPMAVSLAFGILFATVITLILIPSLYVALERVKLRFTKKPMTKFV